MQSQPQCEPRIQPRPMRQLQKAHVRGATSHLLFGFEERFRVEIVDLVQNDDIGRSSTVDRTALLPQRLLRSRRRYRWTPVRSNSPPAAAACPLPPAWHRARNVRLALGSADVPWPRTAAPRRMSRSAHGRPARPPRYRLQRRHKLRIFRIGDQPTREVDDLDPPAASPSSSPVPARRQSTPRPSR